MVYHVICLPAGSGKGVLPLQISTCPFDDRVPGVGAWVPDANFSRVVALV